jgi:hypothetical protein
MAKKTAGGTGKVKGLIVAEHDGITISVLPQKAKRTGRDRLWVQIRQNGKTKKWRVASSLSYARSADIEFVDDPSGKDWSN